MVSAKRTLVGLPFTNASNHIVEIGKIDHIDIAGRLVDRDASKATDAIQQHAGLLSDPTVQDGELIKLFFDDHFRDHPGPTSNLPSGAGAGGYLLVGASTVVDLRPDESEETFVGRHGFNFYEAEALADQGLIIPNMYVRDVNLWGDAHDSVAGLLQKSKVMGERVDRFLEARYPGNSEFVEKRFDDLMDLIHGKSIRVVNQSDGIERELSADDCRIAATRWAKHPLAECRESLRGVIADVRHVYLGRRSMRPPVDRHRTRVGRRGHRSRSDLL